MRSDQKYDYEILRARISESLIGRKFQFINKNYILHKNQKELKLRNTKASAQKLIAKNSCYYSSNPQNQFKIPDTKKNYKAIQTNSFIVTIFFMFCES